MVREIIGVPRHEKAFRSAVGLCRPSFGYRVRSHVAYAYPSRVGSPVTETLSLVTPRSPPSSMRIVGDLHVPLDRSKVVTETAEVFSATSMGCPMK